ncbi:MAG: hypothetical protein ACJA0S_000366 [Rickettsiales bacterium]|jgi:hypothetical protein
MSVTRDTSEEKPVFIKKPSSPFANDPHNHRNGKKGSKTNSGRSSNNKLKSSANLTKFKGSSGGDR